MRRIVTMLPKQIDESSDSKFSTWSQLPLKFRGVSLCQFCSTYCWNPLKLHLDLDPCAPKSPKMGDFSRLGLEVTPSWERHTYHGILSCYVYMFIRFRAFCAEAMTDLHIFPLDLPRLKLHITHLDSGTIQGNYSTFRQTDNRKLSCHQVATAKIQLPTSSHCRENAQQCLSMVLEPTCRVKVWHCFTETF